MNAVPAPSEPVILAAADGYCLAGHYWPAQGPAHEITVLINCATGVLARYYWRYASFLAQHGLSVLTYDYRGIGASRPASLRRLKATNLDWGRLDCEAALHYLHTRHPQHEITVVAHSIGGFTLGVAPSNHLVRRAFLVGAQYAYWRDYQRTRRAAMFMKWHVMMPLLALLWGYFPGKRLGLLEDLPRGVACEWGLRYRPEFHTFYRWLRHADGTVQVGEVIECLEKFAGDILAYSLTDDEYGTVAAIERLLGYFRQSHRRHVRLDPDRLGIDRIGHFGFFHDRFKHTLWPETVAWLTRGESGRTPICERPPGSTAREVF